MNKVDFEVVILSSLRPDEVGGCVEKIGNLEYHISGNSFHGDYSLLNLKIIGDSNS